MDTVYHVDPDITTAAMLPAAFYRDDTSFALASRRIFERGWQWVGDTSDVALPESLSPRELLPGLLDEPVLLARDAAGTLRCLANVCTHRANVLLRAPCRAGGIRCGYHGREFALDGRMTASPGFETARVEPAGAEDLAAWPLGVWGAQAFASMAPAASFEAFFGPLVQRFAGLPVERGRHDPARDRDYHVAAHWALVVENRLEALHEPFVHARPGAAPPAVPARATELLRYGCVQAMPADPDEPPPRDPPSSSAERAPPGSVACFVFPNLLLQVLPWGMALQLVLPLAPDRTRLAARSYVWDERKRKASAPSATDQIEMEDEAIVEQAQRGVRSRAYRGGRYAPAHEQAVHHFHRLVCEFMNAP